MNKVSEDDKMRMVLSIGGLIMILWVMFAIYAIANPDTPIDKVLDAIAQVESDTGKHPDTYEIGPDGELGMYQITPIYVAEVNRILGGNIYALKDRKDNAKARNMTKIHISYHGKGQPIELWPALHRGGGSGIDKLSEPYMQEYMAKINKALEG